MHDFAFVWQWMCALCTRGVLAGSTQVTQEAAWVVMNGIDFRAAAECLFRGDIIRTEKIYKIAVVLTIKIKEYLCTHCYRSRLPTPPHGCAAVSFKKRSKLGKVWLWSQLPHNTCSLISVGLKELKEVYPPFTINLYHYNHFFSSLYVKKCFHWQCKITKTFYILFSPWKPQFKTLCACC